MIRRLRVENLVHRAGKSVAFWVLSGICVVACLVNLSSNKAWLNASQTFAQDGNSGRTAGRQDDVKSRLREGTGLNDMSGTFKIAADRVLFVDASNPQVHFRCLENLMLQRVYQSIRDDDRDNNWIVQGSITEYLGDNYLLLERVVRAPRSATRAPQN